MLLPAKPYEDRLVSLFRSIWFKDKYKYYNSSSYYETKTIDDSSWNRHQFVSAKGNEIIGFIGYSIDRDTNNVYGLEIINFSDEKIIFAEDLLKAIRDIFEGFKFRKLNFSVIIGNPAERGYDRLIQRCGGRIVGIYKEDAKLIDGKYYDRKVYEITAEEYFHTKGSC